MSPGDALDLGMAQGLSMLLFMGASKCRKLGGIAVRAPAALPREATLRELRGLAGPPSVEGSQCRSKRTSRCPQPTGSLREVLQGPTVVFSHVMCGLQTFDFLHEGGSKHRMAVLGDDRPQIRCIGGERTVQ